VLVELKQKSYSSLLDKLKLLPYKKGSLIWSLACQAKSLAKLSSDDDITFVNFFTNPGKIRKKVEFKAKSRIGIIQKKYKHLYVRFMITNGTKG
jgi:hypothetical protein